MKNYQRIASLVANTERNAESKLEVLLRKFDHTLRIGNTSNLNALSFSFSHSYYVNPMIQGMYGYNVLVLPSFINEIDVTAKTSLHDSERNKDEAVVRFIDWLKSEETI